MRENILVKTNTLDKVLQWRYDGLKLREIAEKLKNEYNVNITLQQVGYILKNLKTNIDKSTETKQPTAQDILYDNRIEVVKMYKEGYIKSSIAKKFGVKESDVIDFLSKRRKFTADDYRDILYKYSQGVEPQIIADEYGVNVKSIELVLKKNKVLTTSPRVMANIQEQKEEEIKNELYDPQICKDFIKFINNLQTRISYYSEDIKKFDNTRNDIYHKLEICDMGQDEQLKLLEQIKEVSVERRKLKDFIEVMQPITEFLEDEDNKRIIQTFGNVVAGAMNNLKKLDTRVYFLREEE